MRRDRKGKSDSVTGRGGNKGVLKRWGRFHYSKTAFFTMENYGKDSQEVKREGNKIYDDDTVGKPRGQLVDTQPMVGDGGLGSKMKARKLVQLTFLTPTASSFHLSFGPHYHVNMQGF